MTPLMPFLLGRAFVIPALYIYIYAIYTFVTPEIGIGRKNDYTSQNPTEIGPTENLLQKIFLCRDY